VNIIIALPVSRVFSPLDQRWGLTASVMSDELARRVVWLSGLLPYEQCSAVLARIGEQMVAPSSIWRQTQSAGQCLAEVLIDQQTENTLETYEFAATPVAGAGKGLSLDGGMVNIRGEGWRELKVGAVFDLETALEKHPLTGCLLKLTHGVHIHYAAVLGSKETFKPVVWSLAATYDFPNRALQAVVADGAAWIWDVVDELFPAASQIVDWYHALHHLHHAAQTLYPTDEIAQQKWLKSMKIHLYDGKLALIIQPLIQAGQAELAHYFQVHQARMTYILFRQKGLPLGSGTVESGVKQFKHRLAGAGMRWNLANAQVMIVIRGAVLDNSFDELWDAA
jgi:hypothetical protein